MEATRAREAVAGGVDGSYGRRRANGGEDAEVGGENTTRLDPEKLIPAFEKAMREQEMSAETRAAHQKAIDNAKALI